MGKWYNLLNDITTWLVIILVPLALIVGLVRMLWIIFSG